MCIKHASLLAVKGKSLALGISELNAETQDSFEQQVQHMPTLHLQLLSIGLRCA